MNNNYKIDTERLISAIESKNCIWDIACDEYKNRDIKNKAYWDVAAIVVYEFDTLSEKEKHEAVLLVQKRWKTARDAYVRDRAKLKKIKSGEAAKHIKKYVYFDNLTFLERTCNLNKTETNLDVDDQREQSNEAVDLSESDADVDIEASVNETQSLQNFSRKKRKKADTLDNKLISFLEETVKSDQDDHSAFLTSLLPTLKTFNETQTLQFRSEVLRIIMEIKNIAPHPFVTHQAQSVPTQNIFSHIQQFNEATSINWPSRPSTSYSCYSEQASVHSSDFIGTSSPTSGYNEPNYRPTLLQLSGTQLDNQTN